MIGRIAEIILRFEKNGNGTYKNTRDRIDILKNIITDMMKFENQNKIIMGVTNGRV